jgi:hypothetical protein
MVTRVNTTTGHRIDLEAKGSTETNLNIHDSGGALLLRLAVDSAELFHAAKGVYELQRSRKNGR